MFKKLISKVKHWWKTRKTKISIKKEVKRRGGCNSRVLARHIRLSTIRKEKQLVITDLYNSWRLGELRTPNPEHIAEIEAKREKISWQRLRAIKKYYWQENI